MGSSLLRQYVQMYGNGLAGAIFMGVVADKPYHTLVSGRRLCRFMAAFRGWHYRSRLVDRMAVGAFNKKYRHPQTRADWVTSDPQRLEEYVSDPLCSFMFTVNAYYGMFTGMMAMSVRMMPIKAVVELMMVIRNIVMRQVPILLLRLVNRMVTGLYNTVVYPVPIRPLMH